MQLLAHGWLRLAPALLPTAVAAVLLPGAAPAAAPRLKASGNHRFLVKEDGAPFFYLGDTAWELFHRLNREEADQYLENRALARGLRKGDGSWSHGRSRAAFQTTRWWWRIAWPLRCQGRAAIASPPRVTRRAATPWAMHHPRGRRSSGPTEAPPAAARGFRPGASATAIPCAAPPGAAPSGTGLSTRFPGRDRPGSRLCAGSP
jgi:hypothetical protein